MALTEDELVDELFCEESDEDLTEEQYAARMAAALTHLQNTRREGYQSPRSHGTPSPPRGRRRYSTHLPKKKDVGTVLDYIEYYNSARMAQDTASRLYQHKKHGMVDKQQAGFLRKGARGAKDAELRCRSRSKEEVVKQEKVLSHGAAERVGERLWADSGVHKVRMEQLRAEAEATLPTKWNSMAGGRRLTKDELVELGERLHPQNTFDRRTKHYIEDRLSTAPPCAATYHSYCSPSLRKVVPTDRELADRGRLPPGPWRNASWVPSGNLGVVARHDEDDKLAITGLPQQPLTCAGTPRRDMDMQESVTNQTTATMRAKRREAVADDRHNKPPPWKYN
eukprot:TRINITY_DN20374_c0_g1_i1.p1 TRINITY_DN20374_c0_g1~~TRINITY_DN20374_c0_g1_i1.p1  ORF type:complete len:360 (+),score=96.16 TRINITY_DN20374_c0_g1_i1:68-1081(+)